MIQQESPTLPDSGDRRDRSTDHLASLAPQFHALLQAFSSGLDKVIEAIRANAETELKEKSAATQHAQIEERERREFQQNQLYWLRLSTIVNGVTALAGLVVAGLGLAILYFGLGIVDRQRQLFDEQLGQLRKSNDLMAMAVEAAVRQAKSAEIATKAAQESISKTQGIIRRDQRAWVGAIEAHKPSIAVGSKVRFGVMITNSGKTPALKMTSRLAFRFLPKGEKFAPLYAAFQKPAGSMVLQPGMRTTAYLNSETNLTQNDIDRLTRGEQILYLFGEITYRDIFDADHYSRFCIYLAADLTSVNACDTYNEAN